MKQKGRDQPGGGEAAVSDNTESNAKQAANFLSPSIKVTFVVLLLGVYAC